MHRHVRPLNGCRAGDSNKRTERRQDGETRFERRHCRRKIRYDKDKASYKSTTGTECESQNRELVQKASITVTFAKQGDLRIDHRDPDNLKTSG